MGLRKSDIIDAYKLAIDDAVPFNQKELKEFIHRGIIHAFSGPRPIATNSLEFDQQKHLIDCTNRLKEYLSTGDKKHAALNILDRNIETILFSLNRATVVVMLKLLIGDSEKIQYAQGVKRQYVEFRFKHSHNEYYFQEFGKIIQFIDDKIKELQETPTYISKNIHFKLALTLARKKVFIRELREQGYTNTPQKLIDFLTGDNDAIATINTDRLLHISYLIHRLYKAKPRVLELNFTGGYFIHFQKHIPPFSLVGEKRDMKELKRQVVTPKYNKADVKADVDRILDKIGVK